MKVQSLSAHLVSVDPKKVGTPNTSQTQNQDVHQIFQKHLEQHISFALCNQIITISHTISSKMLLKLLSGKKIYI